MIALRQLLFHPTQAIMQKNPHTDRARFLVTMAVLVLILHAVDVSAARGVNWLALGIRIIWASLLMLNAVAAFRQHPQLRAVTRATNVSTALLYLALLAVTGGGRSPLLAYTPALIALQPVVLPESALVAPVSAALLSLGAFGLLWQGGATTLELIGWGHAFIVAVFAGAVVGRTFRLTAVAREQAVAERLATLAENERLVVDLRKALANVKTLGGLLPICAWCRRVRDDRGYWEQIEAFVRDRTDAEFSHGICPDCERRMLASPSVGSGG